MPSALLSHMLLPRGLDARSKRDRSLGTLAIFMKSAATLILVASAIFVAFALLFPSVGDGPTRRSGTKNDVTQIAVALQQFKSEYGNYPSGSENELIAILQGNNPKGIVFIELPKKQFDNSGNFIDQWGTPYRIDASGSDSKPKVWSFGKNKRDDRGAEDTDDVASWN
jgi:hypothetical protein